MIDGAHALGSLALDIPSLGADYYVANCHKWFCSAKGCAILYVRKELQASVRGPNISHGYGYGFQSEFSYVGTCVCRFVSVCVGVCRCVSVCVGYNLKFSLF